MTAYIANHQKKKINFKKREQELRHAIRISFSHEKVIKAAERLRKAKLAEFKSDYSRLSLLPVHTYMPDEKARKWGMMSAEEIIESYKNAPI